MKTFRIRETYTIRGWTYVQAEDQENAEHKLDQMEIANTDFREDDREHEDIDWDSLEEVEGKKEEK